MTELPALRDDLREIAERRYARRRRPRRALPALVVAAALAAGVFVIADRDGTRPDPEVAATPTATPAVTLPTPTPIATPATPKLDDLSATPVAAEDPSLKEALSLLDPSHRVVRAWSVPGLKGHVLLTRKGDEWCLSAPDPLTDHPEAERGVACAPESRHSSKGDYVGIGNVDITLPPGSETLRIRQR